MPSKLGFLPILGVIAIVFLILFSSNIMMLLYGLYTATHGVIGVAPPKPKPPPPVIIDVGQMMVISNASYAKYAMFPWAGNLYGGIVYWGVGPNPVPLRYLTPITWYSYFPDAFNITNLTNQTIVKVVVSSNFYYFMANGSVRVVDNWGLELPLLSPWSTNATSHGIFVNFEIANVSIAPGSSVVLLNSTQVYNGAWLFLELQNGNWIHMKLENVPYITGFYD